ncbi:sulfite exporter TauE/SafE family protein, partial [Klebsiella pneumoniae]|nr:sulfite exporter TauE/SafE family protein [Klebsiella pneumoniae]
FARRCLPKVSDALHAKIYVLLLIAVLIAVCL